MFSDAYYIKGRDIINNNGFIVHSLNSIENVITVILLKICIVINVIL